LEGYQGALMTDGYGAYRKVLQNRPITHLCCMAHVRRKFVEAQQMQSNGKTGRADMVLHWISKRYGVEQ
jgi:transposase